MIISVTSVTLCLYPLCLSGFRVLHFVLHLVLHFLELTPIVTPFALAGVCGCRSLFDSGFATIGVLHFYLGMNYPKV